MRESELESGVKGSVVGGTPALVVENANGGRFNAEASVENMIDAGAGIIVDIVCGFSRYIKC